MASDFSGQHRLKRLREAQGLSQRELAALIPSIYGARRGAPVQERTIARWETGESIPERHWHQLAQIFAVSVAFLLGLDNDNNGDGDLGEPRAAA